MPLKKQYWLLIIIFVLLIIGCQPGGHNQFAVYLLSQDIAATELSKLDINTLELQSKPVIYSTDIVSYDKNSHTITLTPDAFNRIQQIYPTPVKVTGIPFVVAVGNERIYAGAFWTPLSSLSFDGVAIMQPFNIEETTIQISLGYPVSDSFTGTDPRSDPRIFNAFKREGKLITNP